MELGEKGLALIKHYEGLKLRAYQCSSKKWTIGYGHTKNVRPKDTITEQQAEALLKEDVKTAENVVNKIPNLSQDEYDALVSFVFNAGGGNFLSSSIYKLGLKNKRMIPVYLNLWNRDNTGVVLGLVKRRYSEGLLFSRGELELL